MNHYPRRYADVVSLDAWRARRDAQIDADIMAMRDFADDYDFDLEVTPRSRWLNHVSDAWLAVKIIGAVALLCVAVVLSPLIVLAAKVRGSMTP
jgi:hypothetical protein